MGWTETWWYFRHCDFVRHALGRRYCSPCRLDSIEIYVFSRGCCILDTEADILDTSSRPYLVCWKVSVSGFVYIPISSVWWTSESRNIGRLFHGLWRYLAARTGQLMPQPCCYSSYGRLFHAPCSDLFACRTDMSWRTCLVINKCNLIRSFLSDHSRLKQ